MPKLPKTVAAIIENADRLSVLKAVESSISARDPELDAIARTAAALVGVEIGLVSLVTRSEKIFIGRAGISEDSTPVELSFAAYTIASQAGELVVEDAAADPRFADHPLVRGEHHVHYYMGVPIEMHGQRIGALCVLDPNPHARPAPEIIDRLKDLSRLASTLIELKDSDLRRLNEQAEFRRATARHLLAARAAGIGSSIWDAKADRVECDLAFCTMHERERVLSFPLSDFYDRIHDADRDHVRQAVTAAAEQGGDLYVEYRTHSGNHWILTQGQMLDRGVESRGSALAVVSIDITETKQSEQTTRVLLKELNHRVKNTLAMLQSLAGQTMRRAGSPQLFMEAFTGRLHALAAAHTLLTDLNWGRIDVAMLLQTVIAAEVAGFESSVQITGGPADLGPDEGVGLALVVNELVTNARRFGALSQKGGTVSIVIDRESPESDWISIRWTEAGGPPVPETISRGFGLLLIERGLQKFQGSTVALDFRPSGLEATLRLPVASAGVVYNAPEEKKTHA